MPTTFISRQALLRTLQNIVAQLVGARKTTTHITVVPVYMDLGIVARRSHEHAGQFKA